MVVLANILRLCATNPAALGAQPAHVEDDFAGFTWYVRHRSPAFQRTLSAVVELSTELLGLVALWGLWFGWAPLPPMRWVLPAWAIIQLAVIAVAMAWDVGERRRVVQVHFTPHSIRIGRRQQLPLASLRAIHARAHGVGPLHRAELRVDSPEGRVVIAADGDDLASLRAMAGRVAQWAPQLGRSAASHAL